jgi:hypothetical protein
MNLNICTNPLLLFKINALIIKNASFKNVERAAAIGLREGPRESAEPIRAFGANDAVIKSPRFQRRGTVKLQALKRSVLWGWVCLSLILEIGKTYRIPCSLDAHSTWVKAQIYLHRGASEVRARLVIYNFENYHSPSLTSELPFANSSYRI